MSDLETTIEKHIHSGIEVQSSNIIMIIAYRPATVHNVDTIYTMENRKTVESGNHGKALKQDRK
jgi:ABC-type multidrug transport system fused ATPase/permease subunit